MTAFDFSDLPEQFGNTTELPVARHTGVTFDDGVPTDAGWTKTSIPTTAVFPLSPRELEALEIGGKERGVISIYSAQALRGLAGPGTSSELRADVVEWQGALWQVARVGDWQPSGQFYEIAAVRMDRPETTVDAFIATEAAA